MRWRERDPQVETPKWVETESQWSLDAFLKGPNLLQTLESKRQIMRKHWLDAQKIHRFT
jgi:hypothetical protein